jgi:hypothetical protein
MYLSRHENDSHVLDVYILTSSGLTNHVLDDELALAASMLAIALLNIASAIATQHIVVNDGFSQYGALDHGCEWPEGSCYIFTCICT